MAFTNLNNYNLAILITFYQTIKINRIKTSESFIDIKTLIITYQ